MGHSVETAQYFAYLGRSPHFTDWNQNLHAGCRHNHVCKVSRWYSQGLQFYRRSNFPVSYWLLHGLTTVQHYCTAYDKPKQHSRCYTWTKSGTKNVPTPNRSDVGLEKTRTTTRTCTNTSCSTCTVWSAATLAACFMVTFHTYRQWNTVMTKMMTTTTTSALQNFNQNGHLPVPAKFPDNSVTFPGGLSQSIVKTNTIMPCQT